MSRTGGDYKGPGMSFPGALTRDACLRYSNGEHFQN